MDTADRLAAAVRDAPPGTVIELAAGTYALEAVLELKTGMTLKGAGIDRTVLTHAENWRPATTALPDPRNEVGGPGHRRLPHPPATGHRRRHHLRPHPARAATCMAPCSPGSTPGCICTTCASRKPSGAACAPSA
ncbi:MAG: hypothetical protein U1G05_05785 [Kiritimatiellia bacterium]